MKKLIILIFVIIFNTSLNLHPCQVLKKILHLIILPYVYIIEVGLFKVWCFSLNFSKVIEEKPLGGGGGSARPPLLVKEGLIRIFVYPHIILQQAFELFLNV